MHKSDASTSNIFRNNPLLRNLPYLGLKLKQITIVRNLVKLNFISRSQAQVVLPQQLRHEWSVTLCICKPRYR